MFANVYPCCFIIEECRAELIRLAQVTIADRLGSPLVILIIDSCVTCWCDNRPGLNSSNNAIKSDRNISLFKFGEEWMTL